MCVTPRSPLPASFAPYGRLLRPGHLRSRRMDAQSVVLVTGGGSGIGRGTAQLAAERGAAVAVLDRHEANAQETVASIESAGGRAIALGVDVADDAAVGEAVATTVSNLGRITGLVT